MVADKSWVGDRLTGADLIQLFISKSFFHSHYKKLFSKVSAYPAIVEWLENSSDAPADEDLWGEQKGHYNFKDLERYLAEHENKRKMKKNARVRDTKAVGGSKGDKKKKKQVTK